MTALKADALIVGAGSIGTLTAPKLARSGLSVILIDRDFAGGQSSGVSPGSLRLQGRKPVEMPLSMRAQELPRLFHSFGWSGHGLQCVPAPPRKPSHSSSSTAAARSI